MGGLDNGTRPGGGGSWRELGPQRRIRGQMNNEEAETPRKSVHARLAVARALAKRGLVAFLAFAMAFGTTPAQMWADGVEGIADAVSTAADDADDNSQGKNASDSIESGDSKSSNHDESLGSSVDSAQMSSGTASAQSGRGIAAQQNDSSSDGAAIATQSSVSIDSVDIINEDGDGLTWYNHTVKVGDTVKVAAYYEDDWGDDEEITSSEYARLSYQWYVGDKQSSAPSASGYTAIDGATSRELKLTSDLAGKYVACKVVYGDSSWSYKFTASLKNAIEAGEDPAATPEAKRLAEAKKALSSWKPSPVYGTDTNIVDMLAAKLKQLGYEDVAPSLKTVEFAAKDPNAVGGIAEDGKITYFFLSNADKSTSADYALLRQFEVTYVLSVGSESIDFTPEFRSTLPWDVARVRSYLNAAFAQLDSVPETIDSDVKDGTLPGTIYIGGKKVASISWKSDNDSVVKLTTGYDENYNTVYKATYTHGSSDSSAGLLAYVTLYVPGYGNGPDSSAASAFAVDVTVKAKSAEEIAAEKAELSEALDRIVLKDFTSKKVVDANSVEGDLQLPNTRRSGIDAPSGSKLSYSSSDESIAKVNGYHVVITRDIDGGINDAVITATLTKNGITATRDIPIHIKPIAESEIDDAVSFMDKVKADYQNALLGKNKSADAVTANLSPFSEAAPTADGGIEYRALKDSSYTYVVTSDLPGYDSMSGTSWRTYRSSNTSVIADESLKVTQPEADSLVTVTSNLTYEKYRSLAEAHPENAKLQELVNQQVTATYRVIGTTDHSDPKISVGFQLVGIDADGADEVWSSGDHQVSYGSTADSLIESVLGDLNLEHTSTSDGGYQLFDITSSDGRKLGWDPSTGKFWQLFVNGSVSGVYASGIKLQPGDSLVLYYSAWGASLDDIGQAKVKSSISFIGPDDNGNNSVWLQQSDVKMPSGSTAADLTEQVLGESKEAGLLDYTSEGSGASFYLSSIARNGKTYGWDSTTQKYWRLYVNGSYSENHGAGEVVLKPGDTIQWVYAAYNEKPLDGLVINPSASRPDWDAAWSGFVNGGSSTLVNVPTPSDAADLLWKVDLKKANEFYTSLGDPIIAGGYVFITTNTELIKIDSSGKEIARVSKGGSTSYFSRPIYVNGLIVSANDDGSLCAFSADTLECVWKTNALEAPSVGGSYQSNSTMTVANGCIYAEFVAGASSSGAASAGAMVCVDIATGALKWVKTTVKAGSSTGEGYYWAGACASGSDLVIGDESGYVKLIDGSTGDVKSSVSIGGTPCRATIVSAGVENGKDIYLAVGRKPATLFKIARDGDSLSVVSSCQFGGTSTSTPAVANGKVYIGGSDASNNGQFTVIDLSSMKIEKKVNTGANAGVQASPLVSVQGDDTLVYFTCNKNPGSLYRFSQATGDVTEVYTPSGSDANWCTSSVIADKDGNLYYTNDSGSLFALKAAEGYRVTFDSDGGSTVPAVTVVKNKPMAPIADPVKDGYEFAGWYMADGSKWDFSKAVTTELTLHAKWNKKSSHNNGDGGNANGNGNNNGGNGSNSGSNGGSSVNGSGNGTQGLQAGGAVAPAAKPVAQAAAAQAESETSAVATTSAKKSASSKKKGSKSSSASKGLTSQADKVRTYGATNPMAVIGIAVGVIGLALILVFLFMRRRKEDEQDA